MIFNSYEFIFAFLPVVLVLFFIIGRVSEALAIWMLGIASLIFYSWWDYRFLPVLVGSILFNYLMGASISQCDVYAHQTQKSRKNLLTIGLIINIGLLIYYKYFAFLVSLMTDTSIIDYRADNSLIAELPLGISFFTFTQIAFLVDCYQNRARELHFGRYLLFVTYFPHLIAGPVLHHNQMMPQFRNGKIFLFSYFNFYVGFLIFSVGLSKKVLLANPLGEYADKFYGAIQPVESHLTSLDSWLGSLAYTFQIYFDFSGYSDMAIGLSLMLNIKLPINFNKPYCANSFIDFWKRWHISLSGFLRDYLYIPMGGNRGHISKKYRNLLLTMLIGGIWHGANLTFIVWGSLHGILLVANHYYRESKLWPRFRDATSYRVLATLIVFLVVSLLWVLFRADSLSQAGAVYSSLFNIFPLPNEDEKQVIFNNREMIYLTLLIIFGYVFCQLEITAHKFRPIVRLLASSESRSSKVFIRFVLPISAIILFLISISQFGQYNPFLYFQF